MKGKEVKEPQVASIVPEIDNDKIPALPLRFENLPVELLSKEFTKLNSTHPYRVHYLGPRPLHTLALHRRFAYNQEFKPSEEPTNEQERRYPAPLRRIVNSNYMNERLRDNNHYRSSFFYRAFEGMNPTLPSTEISFNSAFQSANLDCAVKVGLNEFDLFLRIDSNSRGHTNWYYFSIKNGSTVKTPIRLHICNLGRRPGLYDQGLRPYTKSRKGQLMRRQTWEQRGDDIELEGMPLRYQFLGSKANNFYRLSFSYTFQFEDDEVFFAYCPPYTYSDLHQDISLWVKSPYLRRSSAGRSLSGLQLPILHITNHQNIGTYANPKKNVVITGRTHPAQSNGSYVLRGFLTWILGESHEASQLRERVNFFVIPMLNPDGVVLGNSRTSAAGKDLNRQFLSVRKDLYPEVYLTKALIARLQKKHGVILFLDFHGHSRRKNTFFYGPAYPINHREYYRCRAFPRLVEKNHPCFRFYSCSFQISEVKRSAARAVALSQLKVPYAYTVESSVGLYYNPELMKTVPFTISSWEEMGSCIAVGLGQFILGVQELQTISRERKLQRQKLRQGKARQKGSQRQCEGEKRERRKYFLMDIIEDVKVAVAKGGFDDDVESDDHDSDEDLEPYQLAEFNNLVIADKQKQRKLSKKEPEKQQSFEIEKKQEEEIEEVHLSEQIKKIPPRMARSVQPKISWPKISSKNEKMENKIERFSQRQQQSSSIKESKNFIKENKQRYSASNLQILREDRREIIVFPKSPQAKRQKQSRRQGYPEVTTSRLRICSIVDKFCIEKMNLNVNESSAYKGLSCVELDNRAMTITTFRRK